MTARIRCQTHGSRLTVSDRPVLRPQREQGLISIWLCPLLNSGLLEPAVTMLAVVPHTASKGRRRSLYINMFQIAGVIMPSYARKIKDEGNPVLRVSLVIFGKPNKFINCANICVS